MLEAQALVLLLRDVLLLIGVGVGLACGVSILYLLTLTFAATRARAAISKTAIEAHTPDVLPNFTIVIPAHNEEAVLAATLDSLRAQQYPANRFSVVVVADNCTDRTAQLAREHGADCILERTNLDLRGKGYALQWAFAHLLDSNNTTEPQNIGDSADAFVIVDADTFVAPDFLMVAAARLIKQAHRCGASIRTIRSAFQGRYSVLNPEGGWRAALMTAAFELCNHVKLLGAAHLGWAVGLKGNGMVFTRALLTSVPWQGSSITEDIDYGLDLLLHHQIRADYEPYARVWAQMPVGDKPAASQRERWERGRYRLLRDRTPRLWQRGLVERRGALLAAALDLSVPPLAEIVGLLFVWGLLAVAAAGLGAGKAALLLMIVWGVCCAGLVIYVFAGLRLAGATSETWAALWHVPVYVIWKIGLYAKRFVLGRRLRIGKKVNDASSPDVDSWVRTERIALGTPGAENIRVAGSSPQTDTEAS